MIKVSIIIPVYNVSAYIERCIGSVMVQTYPDLECIIVDDCSPDNSIELAKRKLASYTGNVDFRILHHEKNRGLSAARNTGTSDAKGDYVYYFDSDDEIIPYCIEELVALAEKYPDVEIVQGNTRTVPEPEKESDWRNILYKNFPEYVDDNQWVKKHFFCKNSKHIPVNAWNKLIKYSFISENNLSFKEGLIHEDELWMFYVTQKLTSIAFTAKYLYIHHITPGSIITSGSDYRYLYHHCIIVSEVFKQIETLTDDERKMYYCMTIRNLLKMNSQTRELWPIFRKNIKTIIHFSFARRKVIEHLSFCTLQLPEVFYSSSIGKLYLKFLIRLF